MPDTQCIRLSVNAPGEGHDPAPLEADRVRPGANRRPAPAAQGTVLGPDTATATDAWQVAWLRTENSRPQRQPWCFFASTKPCGRSNGPCLPQRPDSIGDVPERHSPRLRPSSRLHRVHSRSGSFRRSHHHHTGLLGGGRVEPARNRDQGDGQCPQLRARPSPYRGPNTALVDACHDQLLRHLGGDAARPTSRNRTGTRLLWVSTLLTKAGGWARCSSWRVWTGPTPSVPRLT